MPADPLSRTSLTRYAPLMQDAQPAEALAAAKDAYVRSGGEIVLLNRKWLKSWADHKQLDLLAERAFGVKVGQVVGRNGGGR